MSLFNERNNQEYVSTKETPRNHSRPAELMKSGAAECCVNYTCFTCCCNKANSFQAFWGKMSKTCRNITSLGNQVLYMKVFKLLMDLISTLINDELFTKNSF